MDIRWQQPVIQSAVIPLMSLPLPFSQPTDTIGIVPPPTSQPPTEMYFQNNFMTKVRDSFVAAVRMSSPLEEDPLNRLSASGFHDLPKSWQDIIMTAANSTRTEENADAEKIRLDNEERRRKYYVKFEEWLLGKSQDEPISICDFEALVDDAELNNLGQQ